MKTLVLAGGFGTRLRPLSCTRPKALFPIANKPLIDFVLEYLKSHGVETVVMGVYYMAEDIVRYLGPTKNGLGILYSREQRPMGTGGPVRKALDLLNEETFTVMNGDIITDFDMGELVRRHKKFGGVATVALTRVENPHIYGSVVLGEDGLIKRFVEKPEYGKAPSNLVNAGIYVFEPEIVDYIPEDGKTRIETQAFPVLVEEGQLYGFENQCFWLDVGSPEDYLRANHHVLTRMGGNHQCESAQVASTAKLVEPCIIGEGVSVGEDSQVGPNVSLGDGVSIGKGCLVENSILFPGAVVEDYSSVKGAILGENCVIEKWVKVEEGSLIGDFAQIASGVTVTRGVSICPSKFIEESILEPRKVM